MSVEDAFLPDNDDIDNLFRQKQNVLREGGPPVNTDLIQGFIDSGLKPKTNGMVSSYIARYRAWHDALNAEITKIPTEIGPPVDEELLWSFCTHLLEGTPDETTVRRNIRLYRNWYDASNEMLERMHDHYDDTAE